MIYFIFCISNNIDGVLFLALDLTIFLDFKDVGYFLSFICWGRDAVGSLHRLRNDGMGKIKDATSNGLIQPLGWLDKVRLCTAFFFFSLQYPLRDIIVHSNFEKCFFNICEKLNESFPQTLSSLITTNDWLESYQAV